MSLNMLIETPGGFDYTCRRDIPISAASAACYARLPAKRADLPWATRCHHPLRGLRGCFTESRSIGISIRSMSPAEERLRIRFGRFETDQVPGVRNLHHLGARYLLAKDIRIRRR